MGYGDIVIHIDEHLDENGIHRLERNLSDRAGVVSACVPDHQRHLMLVDFDPADVRPSEIVDSVRGQGLHAEMIGF